jgi:hypothetical protein
MQLTSVIGKMAMIYFSRPISCWRARCKMVKKPDEKECFWHPPQPRINGGCNMKCAFILTAARSCAGSLVATATASTSRCSPTARHRSGCWDASKGGYAHRHAANPANPPVLFTGGSGFCSIAVLALVNFDLGFLRFVHVKTHCE